MSRLMPPIVPVLILAAIACGGDRDSPFAPEPARVAPGPLSSITPAAGTMVHRAEMRVEAPDGPFAMVHAVLEFQPGTWFPAHVHGGPALYTLVDGSVVVADGGSETVYGAGESYRQETGRVVAAGNFGSAPSTMAVAFVLPEGEQLITFHPGDDPDPALPFPTIRHLLATEPLTRPAPFSVVQLVVDVEPGPWTPVHAQPGPSLVTVLEGGVVLRRPGTGEEVVPAGGGWALTAGEAALVRARGSGARLVGTYLVPEGAVLGG